MSIQEPAWLKRTRPCPFFSQGRCLFADSCNFLHDVKVRSAVNQPLPSSIQVKQSYFPSKRVFDPPSVVVNSASPPSANLASPQNPASPAQDSSRYSGLLSVLSDVIGPPSDPPTSEVTVPASRAMTTIPSTFQSTAHSPTGLHSGSGSFVAGFEMTTTVADTETGQGASSHTEPSSILEPDPEATLVDPSGYHMESLFPEVDAKFLPNHDGDEFADEGTISYFVEATETFLIGSEAEDDEDDGEYMDEPGDEDPTVILSNRQSTLSSFTGVSLLASPRHSIIGEHAVASSIEDGAVDLLSPVELSAKLRLFPIPSLASKLKRGDSIDSGYADGGSWVGPLSFPHSPPRSFQSPVKFPSHSRRVSRCSPALREKRVSYNVGALRPSPPNPIEVIAEVESEGSLEDNDDTACTILGAYGTLPSKEQGEGGACGSLQVHVAEEKAEEDDKASEVCAVMRIPRRYSPDHLHPTREYDLDSCNQLSFISDDNLSFKTALSTQPSYEDLSDASRVSPIKQDSLFSSISGRSTPNTSVLSHYSDANEHSEQSNFGSHVCESLHPVSQIDSTQAPEERPSEECLLPEEVAIDSNAPFASASADDPQGLATEKVVAPRGSLSGVFRYDSRSPISSPSLDTSHGLSLAMDVRRSAAEMAVASRERLSGVFHFDKQPPKSSPSAELSHSKMLLLCGNVCMVICITIGALRNRTRQSALTVHLRARSFLALLQVPVMFGNFPLGNARLVPNRVHAWRVPSVSLRSRTFSTMLRKTRMECMTGFQ
ncbi:hypothetical protein OG21DRAFT_501138 [Imleria badia]|nr:hypothetical protein OG21DRAFT_501138 [Imleria badia]